MDIGVIHGWNRALGPPKDWDHELDGPCATLHVREGLFLGSSACASWWYPTPDELRRLLQGFPVELVVVSTVHPPVCIQVPDAVPATAISQHVKPPA